MNGSELPIAAGDLPSETLKGCTESVGPWHCDRERLLATNTMSIIARVERHYDSTKENVVPTLGAAALSLLKGWTFDGATNPPNDL